MEVQHRLRARARTRASSCSSCSLDRRPLDDAGRRGLPGRYGAEPERFGPPAPPDPPRPQAPRPSRRARRPDSRDRRRPVKVDNELYVRDYSKCILCYKCVDACGEQYQNTFAIAVAGRGFDAHISTEFVVELPESACVYCGNCIAVCPTGALMFRSEHEMREAGEWDARPSRPSRDTICPYCGVGCNLELHVQDNAIVKVDEPRRPRRHPRQPLHQGTLRLPARARSAAAGEGRRGAMTATERPPLRPRVRRDARARGRERDGRASATTASRAKNRSRSAPPGPGRRPYARRRHDAHPR